MTARSSDSSRAPEDDTALVLADAHVHIYRCFDLARFLGSAWQNFAAHAAGRAFSPCLLLTETSSDQCFRELAGVADDSGAVPGTPAGTWRVRRTEEPESLRLEGPHDEVLFLVAGRQIVTRENLEVLALGTARDVEDGHPLPDVVQEVRATGALAAIPWGFGKWFGRRGAELSRYLERCGSEPLFLGDNSGRPALWPEPRHFALARRRGIRVLPGSDPLPMASEAWRPGSYGFGFDAPFRSDRPWRSVRSALLAEGFTPRPFGRGERAHRFVRNQIRMQLEKRRRRSRG